MTRNDFMQLLIQLKNKGQVDDDNQTKVGTAVFLLLFVWQCIDHTT